ncbi:MAG: response regulator [Frankiaceae bacterium]|nr:response regulator [Frankiaceae bacterium]MBV9869881.1 response regulator [Frankiaceae bacterium]
MDQSRCVLIVDDDADSRQLTEILLRQELSGIPCEIGHAEDGLQAVARCQRADVVVMILDMHLPRLDGAAVLRAIKGLPNRPRVIAWTADPAALKHAADHGADHSIDKGRDLRELTTAVAACLVAAS